MEKPKLFRKGEEKKKRNFEIQIKIFFRSDRKYFIRILYTYYPFLQKEKSGPTIAQKEEKDDVTPAQHVQSSGLSDELRRKEEMWKSLRKLSLENNNSEFGRNSLHA